MAKSRAAKQLARSRQSVSLCVKLLLLWMATADDDVDERESAMLAEEFPDNLREPTTDEMIEALRAGDVDCLEEALRTVAGLDGGQRLMLLDLAISMAVADEEVAIAELYILQFLADTMRLGPKILAQRYQEISGHALPEPGDPSSDDWWGKITERRETGAQVENRRRRRVESMNRQQACAVLGVDSDATMLEISNAYNRLCERLDPNRIRELGEDAVAETQRRRTAIETAYQTLRR